MNPDQGEKGKAAVGGFAEKEGLKPRVKEWVGDRIPNNSKYDCWQIKTVYDYAVKCSAQLPSTPLTR